MAGLTQKALARVLELRLRRDDAAVLVDSTVARISQLRRLLPHNPPDAASIEFEISRLQGSLADHKQHADALAQLLAQVGAFQETLKHDVVDAKHVRVRLDRGETILSAIADARQRIADIDAELRRVRHASPTRAEQKAACDAWLDNLPGDARPRINASRHGKFGIEFSDPASYTTKLPIASILNFVIPDLFRESLHAEIDRLPEPSLAMSAEDKAKAMAELRAELLAQERREVELIRMAENEGQRIVYRPFISAFALLGLELKDKGAAKAA
ncbi:hypothetical protein [Afipia clevelandensis]|uniref:Uncharacterized protein n=1 Tax=Afipia clevelandensis ATCC 49720 TaxID=883079 RepID=K8PCP7_9BRAD|nr:hypothetical protein [Afipia clevelandensis]EKS40407.1 hypothetical protein HMPREF9696_00858 [Afipia clevelandensis ATCC 49720]